MEMIKESDSMGYRDINKLNIEVKKSTELSIKQYLDHVLFEATDKILKGFFLENPKFIKNLNNFPLLWYKDYLEQDQNMEQFIPNEELLKLLNDDDEIIELLSNDKLNQLLDEAPEIVFPMLPEHHQKKLKSDIPAYDGFHNDLKEKKLILIDLNTNESNPKKPKVDNDQPRSLFG